MTNKLFHLGFIAALLFPPTGTAQTVATFDDLTLPPNSFFDGSIQPGGTSFVNGNALFPNYFDNTFQYWLGGWAYSNVQDTITAGFTNQFACAAGSGINGSANYAIGQQDALVSLTGNAAGKVVNGCFITNNSYSYLSMRDGDAFSKKFGGVTGNDPDFFKLTIRNWFNGTLTNDSVEFYLADFRYSINALDYIIKDWQWIDLTSLGNSDSLLFTLSSSDVGIFGINTPLFFCMDDFTTADSPLSVASVSALDFTFRVYPNPASEQLIVRLNKSNKNENILLTIIDATGKLMLENSMISDYSTVDISTWTSGIYLISLRSLNQNRTLTFVKK
jgi:hypothetical protein